MRLNLDTNQFGPARRGFTLMHALVALAIIAVFGVIGSQLWVSTYTAARDARANSAQLRRVDLVLAKLRRDLWRATDVTVTGHHQCTLRQSPHRRIRWRVDEDGRLVREVLGSSNKQHWPAFSKPLVFTPSDAGLTVGLGQSSRPGAAMTMVSQRRLASTP